MLMETQGKAKELLNIIANSLYDREVFNPGEFFFSTKEVKLLSDWLEDFKQNN